MVQIYKVKKKNWWSIQKGVPNLKPPPSNSFFSAKNYSYLIDYNLDTLGRRNAKFVFIVIRILIISISHRIKYY